MAGDASLQQQPHEEEDALWLGSRHHRLGIAAAAVVGGLGGSTTTATATLLLWLWLLQGIALGDAKTTTRMTAIAVRREKQTMEPPLLPLLLHGGASVPPLPDDNDDAPASPREVPQKSPTAADCPLSNAPSLYADSAGVE